MANSEKSKIKVLLIYDYFMRRVNSYDENTSVSMPDLIAYLKDVTDVEFERKSIYADIKRINEFMVESGLMEPGDDWIYISNGRKYTRQELKYELSLDEARLIVDAISTTPFTETDLCQKIEEMYPSYFRKGYKSLVRHDKSISHRTRMLLNNIRSCIDEKCTLSFKYGYKFAGGFRVSSLKNTSPLALDWEDGNYYLIAVDNDFYKASGERENSIRRYRIDRIDTQTQKRDFKAEYCGFKDDKDKILDKYLKASVNAYAGPDSRIIQMTIKCDDVKTLLRAYNAFVDDVNVRQIIDDKLERGYIKFAFEASVVPTLFTLLFRLYTFEGVTLDIADEEVNSKFHNYLNNALVNCNKASKDL